MEQVQVDLDQWMAHNHDERTHGGNISCPQTPAETFVVVIGFELAFRCSLC